MRLDDADPARRTRARILYRCPLKKGIISAFG
jgi:hypothetical protein